MKSMIKEFFVKEWTGTEKALVLTVCVLAGIVIGFLFAPIKKGFSWALGCYNANNRVEAGENDWLDEED